MREAHRLGQDDGLIFVRSKRESIFIISSAVRNQQKSTGGSRVTSQTPSSQPSINRNLMCLEEISISFVLVFMVARPSVVKYQCILIYTLKSLHTTPQKVLTIKFDFSFSRLQKLKYITQTKAYVIRRRYASITQAQLRG